MSARDERLRQLVSAMRWHRFTFWINVVGATIGILRSLLLHEGAPLVWTAMHLCVAHITNRWGRDIAARLSALTGREETF